MSDDEKKPPLPLMDILDEINRIRNNALAKLSLCHTSDVELCAQLKSRVNAMNELVYFIADKAGIAGKYPGEKIDIKKEGAE